MALLDRNDAHIKQAILRFVKEDGLNNLQNLTTKKALKLKLTTPQEIVKHCDNYLTGTASNVIVGLKQLMDVERMNPDLTLFKRLDVLEYFGKATRCFFVAAMYFSNGKYKESVSLLQYDDGLFKTAVRKYLENVALVPFHPHITSFRKSTYRRAYTCTRPYQPNSNCNANSMP
jgi:signal recognition particle subunit SRP68